MNTIIISRGTNQVTGINRTPQAFEFAVTGISAKGLTKVAERTLRVPKEDLEGNALFLLPQADKVETREVFSDYETPDKTDTPAMHTVQKKVAVLNDDGTQKRYEVQAEEITPATFDEDGVMLTEETREMVPTGIFHDVYLIEEVEEQKKDGDGRLLYIEPEPGSVTDVTPQEPLEITADDERYEDTLTAALVDKVEQYTLHFDADPQAFSFDDIAQLKRQAAVAGTLYGAAVHFEEFDESLFSLHLQDAHADIGRHAFNLPAGGAVRTVKLALPSAANLVKIKVETLADGLVLEIGDAADAMQAVSAQQEVRFAEATADVYVSFSNPTTDVIAVDAFSLLV